MRAVFALLYVEPRLPRAEQHLKAAHMLACEREREREREREKREHLEAAHMRRGVHRNLRHTIVLIHLMRRPSGQYARDKVP